MSTEMVKGKAVWCCDVCGQVEEAEPGHDFQSGWAILRRDGWRAFKQGEEWCHRCPKCAR